VRARHEEFLFFLLSFNLLIIFLFKRRDIQSKEEIDPIQKKEKKKEVNN